MNLCAFAVANPKPTRSYLDRDLKLLWGRAAARCANPQCRKLLIKESTTNDPEAVIGKIAHIFDFRPTPDSSRADESLSVKERNSYENLILLCGDHHDEVDKQKNSFPAHTLRLWKNDHETWVFSRLEQEIPRVGFAELEVVCQGLLGGAIDPSAPTLPTAPIEKMRKNGLTDSVRFKISLGLSKFSEVETFVQDVGRLSPHFPEELKSGFVARYNQLLAQEIRGDALFEALHEFASAGSEHFDRKAAGLGVLCYLFHKCEVFEP